jgi:hypothetical protein
MLLTGRVTDLLVYLERDNGNRNAGKTRCVFSRIQRRRTLPHDFAGKWVEGLLRTDTLQRYCNGNGNLGRRAGMLTPKPTILSIDQYSTANYYSTVVLSAPCTIGTASPSIKKTKKRVDVDVGASFEFPVRQPSQTHFHFSSGLSCLGSRRGRHTSRAPRRHDARSPYQI